MDKLAQFKKEIEKGYTFKGAALTLGGAMLDGEVITGLHVKTPLKTFNRHGLIAGATGTGKTKTLQVLAEGLSDHGVPVLLMDIKGDLSGLAKASDGHKKIDERHSMIGLPFRAASFPIECLTISDEKGTQLRATVSEFGPVLISKILELNDTQSGVISLIFKYCDDNDYPLLDLKDLKKMLQFITNEGKAEIQKEYGSISTTSVGTITRKIIELEQQGAEKFFGEKSFDVQDLLRQEDKKGIISILRLVDIQDRPKLFSTFMLCLLAEIYATFPEQGDADKPKLVIFIDEAHLIFNEASDALLDQIESIIKLIRSKGVGIFFCTQVPADVPDAVLSQLGLKVQHALRAFTARDRKKIKMAAENFPLSDYYKTDKTLTTLGIGEALVTVLNEKGIPTPLVSTMLQAPRSRMGILTAKELKQVQSTSEIADEYNKKIDRESAYEILNKKLKEFSGEENQKKLSDQTRGRKATYSAGKEESFVESLSKNTMVRQLGRTLMRELTRGLLGALGVKKTTRRRTRRRR